MRSRLLAGYFRRYAGRFTAGIALLLVTNALLLSIPWLLKGAVETLDHPAGELETANAARAVFGYALAIAVVALAQSVVRTGSRLAILGASRHIAYDLRRRLFGRLLVQPPAWYDRMRTGDLMSRAVNDMQLIRSFYGPGVMNFVNTTVSYIGSLAIMAWINPRLCLLALIPYPFVILFMNRLSRALYRRSREAQEQLATMSSRIQESLSGIQQVKAFVREPAEIAELRVMAREYRRKNLALARIRGAIVPLMGSIGGIGTLVVLWFGGRHVIEGRMTLGDFVAFNSYLAGLAWPTLAMGWILNVVQRAFGAADRISEVLQVDGGPASAERGAATAATGTPPPPADDPPPGIRFRSLTFEYEGAFGPALEGLDFEIPPGGSLGVVGPVGSGKSTLLALLSGQYRPPEGTILIGGRDIRTMDLDALRSMVVTVPQESFLFSRSISDNIAFGRPEADPDEISRAAELASLTSDLEGFPRGIETMVGERGVTLSGGQRQRVALARALIVDPRVLILDDTLSAVDATTEVEILENLKPVLAGRTCLVASHRLSAVRDLDRIIVLDGGRVVESGNHEELLAAGGLYARMHRRQQLEEELQSA